ncbi:MAG: cobaltochelatase subunit CobN [Desulfobacterales bacterium]|jgi:cobaltochelatase CobN|nr:cobaltochelatase subunit CobN [Desulfobacterales bacterium]
MKSTFKGAELLLRRLLIIGAGCCVLLLFAESALSADTKRMGLFVGDSDAYTCARALKSPGLPNVEVRIFTDKDIGLPDVEAFIRQMDVAVVDIMQRQPAGWLMENRNKMKADARIYAVRHSGHTQDFLTAGFKMDSTVRAYYHYTTVDNIANLVRFLANRDLSLSTSYEPPVSPPENALYHPDAPTFFSTLAEYVQWYRASGHFQAGRRWNLTVIFPTFTIDGKKEPVDALIRAYETQGINTVTWMRAIKNWENTLDHLISGPPLSDQLGSITGFAFRFSSILSGDSLRVLEKANVPVLNSQQLFFSSKEEWLSHPQGISSVGLAFQFSNPEISGLVEPTLIGLKTKDSALALEGHAFRYEPYAPQVEKLARRAARWHALKEMPNKDKKIFLMTYNHGAGKQNIGASYLNVFRSISRIIARLKAGGYTIEGDFTEESVSELLLKSGRNIGSWAPDELDALLREGRAVLIDMADYGKWLAKTPEAFRENVIKDWGSPEDSKIMTKNGKFVIPCIRLGNLILAPQPVRGFSDDSDKLYHSTTLYPHHQYNAFYFWLQEQLHPDAMISLGTHGTHEWLPGKQAGLTRECAPEVLIGDIPNLYPYIVDDVGEGIQAKRRGRGVIIDHATPPFKQGGTYREYATLTALISEYNTASFEQIQAARLKRIREITLRLGLDKDLALAAVNAIALEKIEHYLLKLKTEMIPYGLHTFGVSPADEALAETARAMAEKGGKPENFYAQQIRACGPSELDSLVRGLSGGFIAPASGNDPIRNPESLPTGKNFYAFDPEKVPSKEAWEAGKQAGRDLIDAYRKQHDNAYPEQVGVVLWSVETIRDEGINVATALYLMGITPIWDSRDKIKTVSPLPAAGLNRPRIDVLLQMSGLFRDTFPQVALMLDAAVKKAAALTDLENFIRKHSKAVEKSLLASGHTPEEAKRRSLVRLYSAPPGAYGTKVDDMAGNSGLWEKDDTVSEQGFVPMQSYGYSSDQWGTAMESAYREHLKSVDATVHTISSNLYGAMDNDDMFQYLGGLSMAVRKASGKDPAVFVSMQRTTEKGRVEPLSTTLGRELRSRYLNPKWIEGMKAEKYAGGREMAEFMENMWGWQVTTPEAVDKSLWEQSYEVYVEDKYGQDIKAFFNKENPWAYQSMTARMLEAVRKGYWQAGKAVTEKLAAEYALNVVEKGVACCDHTCNNPLLNQMVVGIISLPGVLSQETAKAFKLAVEKAAANPLNEQVGARKALLAKLNSGVEKTTRKARPESRKTPERPDGANGPKDAKRVEGYKMEDIKTQDETTALCSSGVQWAASLFVLFLIGLFFWGSRSRR